MRVIRKPPSVDLDDVAVTTSESADGILLFALTLAEIDAYVAPFVDAARTNRLAWLAYPKGGQLQTGLNRDIVWTHMQNYGIQAVRQVAIDDVWTALRFKKEAGS